ncbi:MAG: hypothetical protein V1806_18125 [Pseudomonadota bacterium]
MKKLFAIMVAIAALVAFTAPAMASDQPGPTFVVGGRMLTDVGYNNLSKELTTNKKEDVTTAFVNLAGHSYLHAKFTSADKTTGGFIELGLSSKINNAEAVTLRYAYGWWKVGNCRLLAGQDESWLGTLIHHPHQYLGLSQSAKLLMSNWGYTYTGRHPMVRFEWKSGMFGFALAAATPGAEYVPTAPAGTDYYANMPRFDIAGYLKAGGFWTQPAFGFSQLKLEGTASGADNTFTQWMAVLPAKFTAGPFTAKGEIHYGQNTDIEWDGIKPSVRSVLLNEPFVGANGKIEDSKMLGGFIALEYKVLPVWELTAGIGMEKVSNDAWKKAVANGGAAYKDDNYTRKAYFVAAPYAVTKNFTIHPEFAYYDYGDNLKVGGDTGNEWLLGMQFKFVF